MPRPDSNFQTSQSSALKQVDDAFGEPSDTGLNAALGEFLQRVSRPANNPEDLGVRATTSPEGRCAGPRFQERGAAADCRQARASDSNVADRCHRPSTITAAQIAALNVTIQQQTVQGQQPNDLLDQRDLLLDKLPALANVSVQNNSDGTVNVPIGSSPLVLGTDAYPVTQAGLTAQRGPARAANWPG